MPFCHVIDLNLVSMLFLAKVEVINHFSIQTGTHRIFGQYPLTPAEFGNLIHIAPLSSKFNPKKCRKDINFRWLFLVFLGFWPKTHIVIKSWCLLGFFWIEFWIREGKECCVLPKNLRIYFLIGIHCFKFPTQAKYIGQI